MQRVAVLGTGSIGSRHLRLLREMPRVVPVAVSIRAERAAELSKAGYEVAASLVDAARAGCTSVIVATDTARHGADLELALELNLRVLVEKPLARSAFEVSHSIHLARKRCIPVFTANCLRFDSTVQQAAQWVADRCGRIYSARIWCHSYLPAWRPDRDYKTAYSADAAQGGVLRDLVHEIDLALLMLGSVKCITARTWNMNELGIASEEAAAIILEHVQGGVSTINLDYLSQPPQRGGVVLGRNGSIEWDLVASKVTWRSVAGGVETAETRSAPDEKYRRQLRAFLEPSELPLRWQASGQDGLDAVRVIDAAHESSGTKRCIELKEN